MVSNLNASYREPWNKDKIVGQKAPFRIKDIWALRVRLQTESRVRELALFNLGIDSKLRGCDLVGLKVWDICHGDQVAPRAVAMQHKTQRPVQFEFTPVTREAVQKWIKESGLKAEDFLFPSRVHASPHLGTRQYARILEGWVEELGLVLFDEPNEYRNPAHLTNVPDQRSRPSRGPLWRKLHWDRPIALSPGSQRSNAVSAFLDSTVAVHSLSLRGSFPPHAGVADPACAKRPHHHVVEDAVARAARSLTLTEHLLVFRDPANSRRLAGAAAPSS